MVRLEEDPLTQPDPVAKILLHQLTKIHQLLIRILLHQEDKLHLLVHKEILQAHREPPLVAQDLELVCLAEPQLLTFLVAIIPLHLINRLLQHQFPLQEVSRLQEPQVPRRNQQLIQVLHQPTITLALSHQHKPIHPLEEINPHQALKHLRADNPLLHQLIHSNSRDKLIYSMHDRQTNLSKSQSPISQTTITNNHVTLYC